jgi:hypothetical protein
MLTWEGVQIQGSGNIINKITVSLIPGQEWFRHNTDLIPWFQEPQLAGLSTKIGSTDSQPAPGGGVTIQVTGTMLVSSTPPFLQAIVRVSDGVDPD